jgi:membrane protein required for colicin V production
LSLEARVNQLDALLLVFLVPFALRGWWRGLLREFSALAGLIGGVLVAVAFEPAVAAAVVERGLLPPVVAAVAAFLGLFLGIYVAANLIGTIADRLARTMLLGGLNRMAGIGFGLAKGAVLLGFGLSMAQRLAPSRTLDETIASSQLGRPLTQFAQLVVDAGRGLTVGIAAAPPARGA